MNCIACKRVIDTSEEDYYTAQWAFNGYLKEEAGVHAKEACMGKVFELIITPLPNGDAAFHHRWKEKQRIPLRKVCR